MNKLPSVLNPLALAMLIVVGFATPGWADPVAPCENNASLEDYINLGSTGCTIGNLLFSNFSYPPGLYDAAEVIPAGNVIVETHSGPNAGLTFEGEVVLDVHRHSHPAIGVFSGGDEQSAAHRRGGAQLRRLCGRCTQRLCQRVSNPVSRRSLCALRSRRLLVRINVLVVQTSAPASFRWPFLACRPPSSSTVAYGQAEVDAFTNTFSQVPEPGLLLLLGLGASGLMARQRRRLAPEDPGSTGRPASWDRNVGDAERCNRDFYRLIPGGVDLDQIVARAEVSGARLARVASPGQDDVLL